MSRNRGANAELTVGGDASLIDAKRQPFRRTDPMCVLLVGDDVKRQFD
jgi:hypothetical protein